MGFSEKHFDFLYFLHVHPFHGREFPAWLNVDLVVCNVRIITITGTFITYFLVFFLGYTAMESSMMQQESCSLIDKISLAIYNALEPIR